MGRLILFSLAPLVGTLAMAQPSFPVWDRIGADRDDDASARGERLLSELHCTGCHSSTSASEARWPQFAASDLSVSVRWMRAEFLSRFLVDPHATDPSTKMPDLLVGESPSKRSRVGAALHAFLRASVRERPDPSSPQTSSLQRGEALFHSVGCTACHRSPAGSTVDSTVERWRSEGGIGLDQIGERFHWDGLAEFLGDRGRGHARGSAPGLTLSPSEARDLASYLIPGGHERPEAIMGSAAAMVEEGRQYYDRLHCGQCHELSGSDRRQEAMGGARPFEGLSDLQAGCLSELPLEGVPYFRLRKEQRAALRVALERRRQPKQVTGDRVLAEQLVRFRCYACHSRDGIGGGPIGVAQLFQSSGADMGDEGRLPPSLTGVGRKLRLSAMERIISGEESVRPYMLTRMPRFHPGLSESLAAAFAVSDISENERATAREYAENEVGRNMWGRALIGVNGLGCVSCHQLGGHESLGVPFLDLSHAPQRLRPEWFRDYLLDPASFRPGTRMPAFWPDGKRSLKGFGGSSERQIDSLWAYLNEFDQSRLPDGLVDEEELLLIPEERPIVFRTFLRGVGNHAIAVGFSTGIHAAFDAQSVRLVLAWEGDFLDAGSTWDDRFTPLADPKGERVMTLQAIEPDTESPMTFLGYLIEPESGQPRFQYRLGAMTIADAVTGDSVGGRRLRRKLSVISSDETKTGLWLDVASGKSVSSIRGGFILEKGLRVFSEDRIRSVDDSNGTRVQVYLSQRNRDEPVVVDYDW